MCATISDYDNFQPIGKSSLIPDEHDGLVRELNLSENNPGNAVGVEMLHNIIYLLISLIFKEPKILIRLLRQQTVF